jgi:molecular chaperone GrpE
VTRKKDSAPSIPESELEKSSAAEEFQPSEGEEFKELEEKSIEQLMAEKEQEAKDNYDKWLRSVAEFENFKKRHEREKAEFMKMANEMLVKDFLPVLDSLDRALQHTEQNEVPPSFIEGIELVRKGFVNALEKHGVKVIDALGEKFDPNFHEAVMQQENPDVEDNTVLFETQKGYMLHDRLLRPSMVIVSKKPAQED